MPLNAYLLSFWNDPWEASTAASKHKFVKNHFLTTSCQTTLQQGSGLHMTANGWSQQGWAKPSGQQICCRPELLCLFSDRIEVHRSPQRPQCLYHSSTHQDCTICAKTWWQNFEPKAWFTHYCKYPTMKCTTEGRYNMSQL